MTQLSEAFANDLQDIKTLTRRLSILLPDKLDDCTPAAIEACKRKFYSMQRDTQRKRMSAEVEIRLRNIYFDRIERSMVEDILASIYKAVELLEDIEFLVKYSSQVLPPQPEEALDGQLIWRNILTLQGELTEKRDVRCSYYCYFYYSCCYLSYFEMHTSSQLIV